MNVTTQRIPYGVKSLDQYHSSIAIGSKLSFFRKLLAFSGPGFLVAVGYMDPGNWATDIAGGSRFGYTLLSVILLSNLFANTTALHNIVCHRDLLVLLPGNNSRGNLEHRRE